MIAAAKTARASGQKALLHQRQHATKRCLHATCLTRKSAVGVVQATNMPLSNLMNLVAPKQQQRQQRQPRQQRRPSSAQQQHTPEPADNNTRQPLSVAVTPPEKAGPRAAMATALRTSPDRATGTTSSKLKLMEAFAKDEQASLELVDMADLKRLASMTPTPLRLGDMYKYAASTDPQQRLRNAQFLYRELPIRLAQRAYDLLSLPHGLSSESTPIRQVALMYVHYVQQFQNISMPTTPEEEDRFSELLHSMVLDRTTIPTTIAKGLWEWSLDHEKRGREDFELDRHQEMEDALQRFFTARVGLRFLTEHHILSAPRNHPTFYNYVNPSDVVRQMLPMNGGDAVGANEEDDKTSRSRTPAKGKEDRGCIQHDCNAVLECQKVAQEVARQTYDCYGICPEIEIVDRQSTTAQVFTYVPHHLHYMLAELLKNSCRASVERYVPMFM